jgi:N-acetylmuramoyl-L-alanine amidase
MVPSMRGLRRFFFIFITCLLVCGAAYAADITGLRYGINGEKTRIVFDLTGQTQFRAFLLSDPYRLAVDLPPARWKIAASSVARNPLVRQYRSGTLQKDGLTRVIFDLAKPAIISEAFTLPKSGTAPDRLVIDLAPVSHNTFVARMQDVAGTRDLGGSAPVPRPQSETARRRNADMDKIAPPKGLKLDAPTPGRKKAYTVVIDAGHGGDDPGAIAGGIREKNITLSVVRELRRQLEETGRYVVVLTRDRDNYIKLRDRLAISRKVGGDLFISIHADKVDRSAIRGASIYTLSENASDDETARLAETENRSGMVAGVDLGEESQDVADILLDLAMREKMNESNLLAQTVENALRRKNVRLLPNSHRSAGFAVLKAPDVPAILIETGFLSNPDEAKLLTSSTFQRNFSTAVMEGIDAYFRKMEALQRN